MNWLDQSQRSADTDLLRKLKTPNRRLADRLSD
jgi:hypothetical protein